MTAFGTTQGSFCVDKHKQVRLVFKEKDINWLRNELGELTWSLSEFAEISGWLLKEVINDRTSDLPRT